VLFQHSLEVTQNSILNGGNQWVCLYTAFPPEKGETDKAVPEIKKTR
jgi:hypothetical protein